ncbi:hypothetical protein C8T65DRAFT_42004 [Cerioporus squamosus]|nr:hypothetical protein C8T65DRAFT_42004 [Cerioporus squamosus]
MSPNEKDEVSYRVLRRILAQRSGKPLWDYSSINIEQFVRAVICVVAAHKGLADNDTLHREMSARNILLDVKDTNVMDDSEEYVPKDYPVEAARDASDDVAPMSIDVPEGAGSGLPSHSRFITVSEQTPPKSQPGDGITGTAIFMAQRVLDAVVNNMPIIRTSGDDLESICWVMFYAVYKHGLQDEKACRRWSSCLRCSSKRSQ